MLTQRRIAGRIDDGIEVGPTKALVDKSVGTGGDDCPFYSFLCDERIQGLTGAAQGNHNWG